MEQFFIHPIALDRRHDMSTRSSAIYKKRHADFCIEMYLCVTHPQTRYLFVHGMY
jgi:hypothetical protein